MPPFSAECHKNSGSIRIRSEAITKSVNFSMRPVASAVAPTWRLRLKKHSASGAGETGSPLHFELNCPPLAGSHIDP